MAIEPIKGFYVHDEVTDTDGVAKVSIEAVQEFEDDIRDETSKWLDDHPEATTTVEDGAITESKINSSFLQTVKNAYVTPKQFGAVVNGVANIQAFEDMIAYANANDLNIVLDEDFDFNFIEGSTIDSPTRIRIKDVDGLIIYGNGHAITMKGLTYSYITSIDDMSSSGRDIFTVFSVINSKNVYFYNIDFYGEYSHNGHKFRQQSPRAKGIGFIGSENCGAYNINGYNIFGNTINATNSYQAYDGALYKNSKNLTVMSCFAQECYENGINYMGGVEQSEILNCRGTNNNANGVECGGYYNTVRDFYGDENIEAGVSISGEYVNAYNIFCKNSGTNYTPTGSESYGAGFRVTSGNHHIAKNITVVGCATFGIYIFKGVTDVLLDTLFIKNNADNAPYSYQIYANGTATDKIKRITIKNAHVTTENTLMRPVILQNAEDCELANNKFMSGDTAGNSIYTTASDTIRIIGNVCNKQITLGSTATNVIKINNIVNGILET